MKNRLLSPSSFFRLPWIAWNAPPAIISDMSGPTLLGLFGAMAVSGTPPTRVLKPDGRGDAARRRGRSDASPKPSAARPWRGSWRAEAQPFLLAAGLASFDLPESLALEPFSPLAPSPDEEDELELSLEDDEPSFEEESFEDDESLPEEPSAAAAVSRWRLRVP